MSERTFIEKLIAVQSGLEAPKGQFNKFGNYSYRSCEDIIEAVKPLLKENGLALNISDEIVMVGDRVYVKAVAKVIDGNGASQSATAYAREPDARKGMDESQITGSSSSYARKYALNGLFAIDDNKDADSNEANASQEAQNTSKSSKGKKNDKQPIQELPSDYCTICRLPVTDFEYKDKVGRVTIYRKADILKKSTEKYHAPVCFACMAKKVKAEKAKSEPIEYDPRAVQEVEEK